MAKRQKERRPKARLPRGLRDIEANELHALHGMLARIREVYESYGFEPLETPAFEYTDAMGKFLPDQDRPNEGVFSFEDEDRQWLSLRYDLTAPLARYVAEHYQALPKPFRRYQTGEVWRNEKPGPGRYRQFPQFDADTIGTDNVAADAEICMLAADTLSALGMRQGDFVVRVNNRKVLDGVLEGAGLDPQARETAEQRMTILRAIDKLDRLQPAGVELLLGEGRKDESGDFTKGAGLAAEQITQIMAFVTAKALDRKSTIDCIEPLVRTSAIGCEGLDELVKMHDLFEAAEFSADQVIIDPAVVRGLEYYTGPVFEAELMFETNTKDRGVQRFGSVGGGGRYDGLVQRFKGVRISGTGFSIGVSRLYAALRALNQLGADNTSGPVVVLVMDPDQLSRYQLLTRHLRDAGIRAEMYLGTSGVKAQMKYADKRRAPCVIIQGDDELSRQEVTVKDLIEGARLSKQIENNAEWRASRPAQFTVPETDLAATVQDVLKRYVT